MTAEPSRRALLLGALALAAGCSGARTLARPSATPGPSGGPGISALRRRLGDRLLLPTAPGYAAAVRVYSPAFSSHPLAVARCASEADVAACVAWAAETGTPLHVRAGGHSYGGWSSGPGLVVDLRPLRSVVVSGTSATIGGGALLTDVYAGLAARGRAVAAGSCPTVGFSGLALGGGVGVLTRAFGLTCDAVTGARVVTADGAVRDAGGDLLWALRGGGGSFGVVTSWTVATHPAPTVETFYLAWPLSVGPALLDAWQHWAPGADRRLWSTCKLLISSRDRALVAGTWIGPPGELDAQLAPLLRAVPTPVTRAVRTRGYGDAMLFEAGCSGLTTRSCTDRELADAQPFAATSVVLTQPLDVAGVLAPVRGRPAGLVEGGLSFDALGGAVSDVAPDGSAFPWRHALATVQATATYRSGSPAPYEEYVQALRSWLVPRTGDTAYSNYADASIAAYGPAYWGASYPRLQAVKRAVDPHDLFRWPQSVRG